MRESKCKDGEPLPGSLILLIPTEDNTVFTQSTEPQRPGSMAFLKNCISLSQVKHGLDAGRARKGIFFFRKWGAWDVMGRVGILSIEERLKTDNLNIKLGLYVFVFKNMGVFLAIQFWKM